ncbi:MAG: threonylcarbamoyl-AMP synthase [Lachnospiraceae bacterium]|nr:threonylcarbamoyl-AMP synthase [Lachnospiraceae bacterium]
METKIVTIGKGDSPKQIDDKLAGAGDIIRQGGLVAFPTETVYGLGGDALNPESSEKIYEAKGRPSDNPLIIHIADMADLDKIVNRIPEKARKLADAFWPGPLTMIFEKSAVVPYQTTGGLDTVAVRMPSHPLANRFIKKAGGYVAAPSANLSGKPSPTLAKYVVQDMNGRIDMIIDAEGVEIGLESTIVDMTCDIPVILRPGYITQQMLSAVVGETDMDVTIYDNHAAQAPKAPGMKYRHYAPKGDLVIVEGVPKKVVHYINEQTALHELKGERTGIIGTEELLHMYHASSIKNAGKRNDFMAVARQLYTFLREFDDEDTAYIYVESSADLFADEGLGQAVINRLLKAAGHKVIHV